MTTKKVQIRHAFSLKIKHVIFKSTHTQYLIPIMQCGLRGTTIDKTVRPWSYLNLVLIQAKLSALNSHLSPLISFALDLASIQFMVVPLTFIHILVQLYIFSHQIRTYLVPQVCLYILRKSIYCSVPCRTLSKLLPPSHF